MSNLNQSKIIKNKIQNDLKKQNDLVNTTFEHM